VTFMPEAFDSEGNYPNSSDGLFRAIGALMAPDDAPPWPPSPAPSATEAAHYRGFVH